MQSYRLFQHVCFFHLLIRAGEERAEAVLGRGCGQSGQEVEQQGHVWQIEALVPSHASSEAHTRHADAGRRAEEGDLSGAPEAEIPPSFVGHRRTPGETPGSRKLLMNGVQFWKIRVTPYFTVKAQHREFYFLLNLCFCSSVAIQKSQLFSRFNVG